MRITRSCSIIFLAIKVICQAGHAKPAAPQEETLLFGRFGDVHSYRNVTTPKHVVLFASGDGGGTRGLSTWRGHCPESLHWSRASTSRPA